MRLSPRAHAAACLLLACLGASAALASDVIRLRPAASEPESGACADPLTLGESRRGFDYAAFQARLEALWFQRKAFLKSGRAEDAREQLVEIRSFCDAEAIHRLESVAGALLAEARRQLDEGDHDAALETLEFALGFDPGSPQAHRGRAEALWRGSGDVVAVAREFVAATRLALIRSIQTLELVYPLTLLALIGLVGGLAVFSLLMLFRYQGAIRHDVEEWLRQRLDEPWVSTAAWAVLVLPLLSWVGAGWIVPYWIVLAFRYMTRGERAAGLLLLIGVGLAGPAREIGIRAYGASADPATRSALSAASGGYAPERIMKLRQLVQAHPEDPVYRFLLAGLYKNGRFFEEAFAEYKEALRLAPRMHSAYVNIGNIFYATGQYAEAANQYRRALELEPQAFLAHFNSHIAQSEAFRFADAETALAKARDIDPARVLRLLTEAGQGGRPRVPDATLGLESLWRAALAGRELRDPSSAAGRRPAWLDAALQPVALGFLLAPLLCGLTLLGRSMRARACIRCGQPFCGLCKREREAKEYCSQCLHLFVLGDGLAARSKQRKLYEVERHERVTRGTRRLLSLLVPGTAQVLRGRCARGLGLCMAWLAALVGFRPQLMAPIGGWLGADPGLAPLDPAPVPVLFQVHALALAALLALPLIWILGNGWRRPRREA